MPDRKILETYLKSAEKNQLSSPPFACGTGILLTSVTDLQQLCNQIVKLRHTLADLICLFEISNDKMNSHFEARITYGVFNTILLL